MLDNLQDMYYKQVAYLDKRREMLNRRMSRLDIMHKNGNITEKEYKRAIAQYSARKSEIAIINQWLTRYINGGV